MPAAKKPAPSASMTMSSMGCSCAKWTAGRTDGRALMVVKCHPAHRFSRRSPWRRYQESHKCHARSASGSRRTPGQLGNYLYEIPISPPLDPISFSNIDFATLDVRLQFRPRDPRDDAMSYLAELQDPANSVTSSAMPVPSQPNSCPTSSARPAGAFRPRAKQQDRPRRAADPVAAPGPMRRWR